MFKKKCLFGGGLGLGSSIAIFASISSDVIAMEAVKPKNSIHDFRSELNQIVWDVSCSQEEWANEYFDAAEQKWILDDKYKDSRTKVIGKAIGDCVAGEGAFEDKTPEDIITFKDTNPETYKPENWNAVILYNYVHEVINGKKFKKFLSFDDKKNRYYYNSDKWGEYTGQTRKVSDVLQDKLKEIKKYYKGRYDTKLEDAVNDIQKYVEALELNEWLLYFGETETNYRTSGCPLCSDLAPYLGSNFSECGGAILSSFYRVDKDNALTKRLSYGLELRYYDRNLYVLDLNMYEQSFGGGGEDDEEYDEKKWSTTHTSTLLDLSELKESSKFRWIMDRLEGLVTPPSEDLWNEWLNEVPA